MSIKRTILIIPVIIAGLLVGCSSYNATTSNNTNSHIESVSVKSNTNTDSKEINNPKAKKAIIEAKFTVIDENENIDKSKLFSQKQIGSKTYNCYEEYHYYLKDTKEEIIWHEELNDFGIGLVGDKKYALVDAFNTNIDTVNKGKWINDKTYLVSAIFNTSLIL